MMPQNGKQSFPNFQIEPIQKAKLAFEKCTFLMHHQNQVIVQADLPREKFFLFQKKSRLVRFTLTTNAKSVDNVLGFPRFCWPNDGLAKPRGIVQGFGRIKRLRYGRHFDQLFRRHQLGRPKL